MRSKFLTCIYLLFPLVNWGQSVDTLQLNKWLDKAKSIYYSQPSEAMLLSDSVIQYAEGRERFLGQGYSRKGVVFWALGELDSALTYETKALEIFSRLNHDFLIASSQNNIGLYTSDKLDFETSLKNFMASEEYFARVKDYPRLANVYNNIANIHNRLNHQTIAKNYYRKAGAAFQEAQIVAGVAMVNSNLGLLAKSESKHDSAKWYFELAQAEFQEVGNPLNEAKVLINLGAARIQLGDTLGGKADFERSLKLARALGNPAETGAALLKLAHLDLMQQRPDSAIKNAYIGLELVDSVKHIVPAATLHQILSLAYEAKGQVPEAYSHLKTAFELKDSIYNLEKQRAIADLEIQHQSQIQAKEIEVLTAKEDAANSRTLFWVTLLGALLLVAVLLYLRQRAIVARETRLKEQEQKMRRTENALADAELKGVESEKKRLASELEYKGKELSKLALHIVQKNELLEQLNEEIKELRSTQKTEDAEKIKNLSLFTSQMLSLEKDREEFQIYIQEANQSFFANLEEKFPKLTARDRRLCAMIKLGYSSKDISTILNIETSSVEVSRYRLRKKLGLEKSVNLQEFLNSVA